MKPTRINKQTKLHGHNAPWMLPIWGFVAFVGLNAILYFGLTLGLITSAIIAVSIFGLLAKNKDKMPITMRPDTFEKYYKLRQNEPEVYELLKTSGNYSSRIIAEFEYVEARMLEQELKSVKQSEDIQCGKSVELAVVS